MRQILGNVARYSRALEDALLIAAFVALLLLAGTQIVMRNFLGSGFSWIDPLLRILVLWVGMLGAVVATREDRHIGIDVLSRFVPLTALPWLKRVTAVITAIISGLLAWHTFRFVRDEHAYSDVEVAGLPVWMWQAILPFGFALMTWRFLLNAVFPKIPDVSK